jgi:hypothetical protein
MFKQSWNQAGHHRRNCPQPIFHTLLRQPVTNLKPIHADEQPSSTTVHPARRPITWASADVLLKTPGGDFEQLVSRPKIP